jgi:acetylornithine deacetylase/succinyl-diaminopimelate desuccinylase-like protein
MDRIAAQLRSTVDSELVELLEAYLRIECLSPDFTEGDAWVPGIDEAVALLASWAESRGIPGARVTVQRIEGRTPAIVVDVPATGEGGASGTVLLYGHLDKQPPLGDWSDGLEPFAPVRRGDLLFGRGAADDGYALPAALLAIEASDAAGVPRGRCVVLIEASEESGSPDLDAHLDALLPSLGDVDLVVCLDSGALDYRRLWVTTSLRGNVLATLTVHVLDHGVHSGEAGGVVPSSFRVIRQLLDRIEDPLTGQVLLESANVAPPASVMADAALVDLELDDPLSRHFPTTEGLVLMGRDGVDRLLRQSWGASLSVTGAAGLPPTGSAGNVLRPSTTLKLSLRTPPSADVAAVAQELEALLTNSPPEGATVTVSVQASGSGWVAPPPPPWLLDALEEGSRAGFGERPGLLGEGGSIPFLASLGARLPLAHFVVTGVLGPGSNAHGPDEALSIPAAANVAIALVSILGGHGRQHEGRP